MTPQDASNRPYDASTDLENLFDEENWDKKSDTDEEGEDDSEIDEEDPFWKWLVQPASSAILVSTSQNLLLFNTHFNSVSSSQNRE